MDKRNFDYILPISALFVSVVSLLVLDIPQTTGEKMIMLLGINIILILLVISYIVRVRSRHEKKDRELDTLNKIIEYSKKRTEIEEEINLLRNQLENSSLSEYLDINRLVFSGQNVSEKNKGINYDSFLTQFGLKNNEIKVIPNSAVFLTPFNNEGDKLFEKCRNILSNFDMSLKKTDNQVEKDDILMNIVSLIVKAELIIVNINGQNPNVYYELGIAHAIGKPTILLSRTNLGLEDIGFDIRQKRIIMYRSDRELEQQLLYQVSRIKSKG